MYCSKAVEACLSMKKEVLCRWYDTWEDMVLVKCEHYIDWLCDLFLSVLLMI